MNTRNMDKAMQEIKNFGQVIRVSIAKRKVLATSWTPVDEAMMKMSVEEWVSIVKMLSRFRWS